MCGPFSARFGAWLCLVGALALGLVPGQALVLCLGPGGTVALEGRPAEGSCAGCPELSGDEFASALSEARLEDAGDCPCTDVLVGQASAESKTKPKRVELAGHGLAVVPAASAFALGAEGDRARAPAAGPIVDPCLASIRTVVLRL